MEAEKCTGVWKLREAVVYGADHSFSPRGVWPLEGREGRGAESHAARVGLTFLWVCAWVDRGQMFASPLVSCNFVAPFYKDMACFSRAREKNLVSDFGLCFLVIIWSGVNK
jgi:hypothetical protein